MRRFFASLVIIIGALPAAHSEPSPDTRFSPRGGTTEYIVKLISKAESEIKVAAYSFSSEPITKALIQAHKRGVDVRVVLDKSNRAARYSAGRILTNAGVPVRINSRYVIMHNKFMIFDSRILQTGSFNYTKSAEYRNAENIIITRRKNVVKLYTGNWQRLWDESEDYKPK